MIRKQDLNKNWSDLSSVLFESLPESLQDDQQEWLLYHWNLVVGKEVAYISNVDKIAKGTLQIRIQGKEWLPALESLKKKIIQEINSRAGKNLVKNIKFKI
jgi:predicted nucleic acid-binding Zn ribbon protein